MSNLIPAITVKNLAFYYGTFKALQGVSLDIYQKQVTALIGPSGCGKSTFIKSLNRIGELESNVKIDGKVEFSGQDFLFHCFLIYLNPRHSFRFMGYLYPVYQSCF